MTSVAQQGDNLQSLITSLKSQIQDLKVEKDALDEANLKLCQEIEASVAKSQAMEGKLADFEKESSGQIKELKDEVDRVRSVMKEVEAQRDLVDDVCDKLEEERDQLKDQLNEAIKAREDVEASSTSSHLQQQIVALKAEIGKKNIEYASLKVDVERGELEFQKKCKILQVSCPS